MLHSTAKHSLHLSLLRTVASLTWAPWYQTPGLEMKKWPDQKAAGLRQQESEQMISSCNSQQWHSNSYFISSPITCIRLKHSPKIGCLYFRTFRQILSPIFFSQCLITLLFRAPDPFFYFPCILFQLFAMGSCYAFHCSIKDPLFLTAKIIQSNQVLRDSH